MEFSVLNGGILIIRSMVVFGKEPIMLALYGIAGYFRGRCGVGGVRSVVASTG